MRPSAVAGATAAVPGTPRPPLSGTHPAAAGTLPTAAGSRTGSQSRCCSTWPAGILVRWGGGGSLAGADACMHPGGSCGRAGSSTAASIQHSRRAECACLPARLPHLQQAPGAPVLVRGQGKHVCLCHAARHLSLLLQYPASHTHKCQSGGAGEPQPASVPACLAPLCPFPGQRSSS
jgi:hypothetical protein